VCSRETSFYTRSQWSWQRRHRVDYSDESNGCGDTGVRSAPVDATLFGGTTSLKNAAEPSTMELSEPVARTLKLHMRCDGQKRNDAGMQKNSGTFMRQSCHSAARIALTRHRSLPQVRPSFGTCEMRLFWGLPLTWHQSLAYSSPGPTTAALHVAV